MNTRVHWSNACQRFYVLTPTRAWRFLPTLPTMTVALTVHFALQAIDSRRRNLVKATICATVGGPRHTPELVSRKRSERNGELFGLIPVGG